MIGQHLRRYSAQEMVGRRWVLSWQAQGFDLRQQLAPGHHLLHFVSDSGWEGIIDLDEWFSRRAPQCAALASASWSTEQLETLFVNCTQPIDGLPPALAYQQLESKGRVDPRVISADCHACLTPQGRVWIHVFPDSAPHTLFERQLDASALPLHLCFHIGYSMISAALLKQIQPGDVLLVNHERGLVTSQTGVLGQFIKTEEGFMFNDDDNQGVVPFGPEETPLPQEHDRVSALSLVSRDNVKVSLDFIVQQSTISVAELESFYRGQVIPCRAEAQQNMLIAVNGVPIAKGELVWIDDRLGVEIKEIHQEVGHVAR